MEGIASCRECGNTVRGKIGVDLKCACGRVFKIPDEPIYHANKPAPLEKLKNVPIMSLLDFILDSRKAGDGNNFPVEFSFSIQPVNRLSGRNSSSGSNGECFARRPRPDLFVEGRKVLIVADLPDHKKNQVSINLEGDCLAISSLRHFCNYKEEFILPAWAKKIVSIITNNGLLIVEIVKGP